MNKKAILLIEDNPLLTGLYASGFKKKGLDVVIVHNGDEGIKAIEEHQPDIVLLDLFMPGMSGFDVLKKIRDNPKTKELKVVILTVSNEEAHRKTANDLGVLDYILKQELHLNDIIDRVLSHLL